MPAIPIAMVAISAYSAYKNSKAASAQNKTMAAAQQEQAKSLQMGRDTGQSLLSAGMPATQNALNYYGTLLRGNRAAMQQANAGSIAQLTDTYRGAQRGLERQGVRGGERATALAELNRDRANAIAQLTTGQQGHAADMLANIGGNATGQGVTAITGAATGYGNLATQSGTQGQFYTGQARSDMQDTGRSAGEILKWWNERHKGNGGFGGGSGGGIYDSSGRPIGE